MIVNCSTSQDAAAHHSSDLCAVAMVVLLHTGSSGTAIALAVNMSESANGEQQDMRDRL